MNITNKILLDIIWLYRYNSAISWYDYELVFYEEKNSLAKIKSVDIYKLVNNRKFIYIINIRIIKNNNNYKSRSSDFWNILWFSRSF